MDQKEKVTYRDLQFGGKCLQPLQHDDKADRNKGRIICYVILEFDCCVIYSNCRWRSGPFRQCTVCFVCVCVCVCVSIRDITIVYGKSYLPQQILFDRLSFDSVIYCTVLHCTWTLIFFLIRFLYICLFITIIFSSNCLHSSTYILCFFLELFANMDRLYSFDHSKYNNRMTIRLTHLILC